MSFFGTSRLAVRKKVLDKIPVIPESIVIEADEYLAIVSTAYYRGGLLAEPLTFYRLDADNLYQFRDRNPTKLRRVQRSLESFATELELALTHASVAPACVEILTQTLRNGAKRMRIELDGGTRREVFQVERARQRFHQPDAPFTYRLFQYFGLALAVTLGARRFYRLRDWHSTSLLREWRSKVANPSPEMRFTSSVDSPETAIKKTEEMV